jgi:hypothetical protein
MIFFFKLEFELNFQEFKLSLCYFCGFVGILIIWTSFVLLVKWLIFLLLFDHITAWLVCWFLMCFVFVIKKKWFLMCLQWFILIWVSNFNMHSSRAKKKILKKRKPGRPESPIRAGLGRYFLGPFFIRTF